MKKGTGFSPFLIYLLIEHKLLFKSLAEFLGGIVAHFLKTEVHCRYFKYYSQVSTGAHGYGERRYLDIKNLLIFGVKAHSVVHFALYPRLKLNDKLDFFAFLYRAGTEYTTHVDNSNTAKLHIMANDLGRASNKSHVGYLAYLNGIIGNKTVTALDKLNGGFTFTDTAVSRDEYTLTVNLNKNTVSCDLRREVTLSDLIIFEIS